MTTNMPTMQEFDSARESLTAEAEILSTSTKELIDLKPTCIDTIIEVCVLCCCVEINMTVQQVALYRDGGKVKVEGCKVVVESIDLKVRAYTWQDSKAGVQGSWTALRVLFSVARFALCVRVCLLYLLCVSVRCI